MVTHLDKVAVFNEPFRGCAGSFSFGMCGRLMILSSCLARLNIRPSIVVSRLIRVRWLATDFWHDGHCAIGIQDVRSRLTIRSSDRRCLIYALIVAVVTCESFMLPKNATHA